VHNGEHTEWRHCCAPAFSCWRRGLVCLVVASGVLTAGRPAAAAPFADPWRWRGFSTQDGLPSDRISHLCEARDGVMWAATTSGLAWFDQFHWHPVGVVEGIPESPCQWMAADAVSGVLVVLGHQVYRGNQTGFVRVSLPPPQPDLQLRRAVPAPGGGVVASFRDRATQARRLLLVRDGARHFLDGPLAPANRQVWRAWSLPNGTLWTHAEDGVYRWADGRWRCHLHEAIRAGRVTAVSSWQDRGLMWVEPSSRCRVLWEWDDQTEPTRALEVDRGHLDALAAGPDGQIVAIHDAGQAWVRANGVWSNLHPLPPSFTAARCACFGSHGDFWIGTDHGLYLYTASSRLWTHWSRTRGRSIRVNEILRTRAGEVWIASSDGLEVHRPNGRGWARTELGGRSIADSTGLAQDGEGAVWLTSGSAYEGAFRFDGQEWEYYGPEQGLPGYRHKVRIDRRGRPWFLGLGFGASNERQHGTGAAVRTEGSFEDWTTADGLLHNRVFAFAETPSGERWFGTVEGLSRWRNGEWTHWTADNGLKWARVWALAVDQNDVLWFSDGHNGLGTIREGSPQYLTPEDGLPDNSVEDIRADPLGGIWVSCAGAVARHHQGRWYHFPADRGIGHANLWPVLPLENRVFIGTRGAGTAILDRGVLDGCELRVALTGPVRAANTATFRWRAAARNALIGQHDIETRFRLAEGTWSEWSAARVATVPASPGRHRFTVQARSRLSETPFAETHLGFAIPVPFHRDPRVVGLAACGLVSLVGLAVRDVVRQRRNNATLRESEARIRTLTESLPGLVYSYDVLPDARRSLAYLGPGLGEILGPRAAADLGNDLDRYFDLVHPEDLPALRRVRGTSEGADTAVDLTYRVRHESGEYRWVRSIARATELPRGAIRWHGVLLDINEQVRAETAFREHRDLLKAVIEGTDEVVFLKDLAGRYRIMNQAGARLVDRSVEEVIGRTDEDLFADQDVRIVRERDRRVIETGAPQVDEVTLVTANGKRHFLTTRAPHRDGSGTMVGIIGVARDVTELRQAQERARHAERLASMGTLAAGIAHEINNPVGGMLLAAQNALAGMGGEDGPQLVERSLQRVVTNSKRCAEIIRSVLQFARQQPTEKWVADLSDALQQAVALTRSYASERGAVVRFQRPAEPATAPHNPVQMEQVFVNLIRNAIESRESGAEVDLLVEQAPDRIGITVEDNGRGLTDQERAHLFDPFFTTRRQAGGTGLGLSITHGIVEEHGGRIDVRSRPGEGTRITVELPRHPGGKDGD